MMGGGNLWLVVIWELVVVVGVFSGGWGRVFVVIGINMVFSSCKRWDFVCEMWML